MDMKWRDTPAACPHLTGTPDAHSEPAAPSSTTPAAAAAAAANHWLTILTDSVDAVGPCVAGIRLDQEDARLQVPAAMLATAVVSFDSARLMQGSPPPSALVQESPQCHCPSVPHCPPHLSQLALHSLRHSRSMAQAYYLPVPSLGPGSRLDRDQARSAKTRKGPDYSEQRSVQDAAVVSS